MSGYHNRKHGTSSKGLGAAVPRQRGPSFASKENFTRLLGTEEVYERLQQYAQANNCTVEEAINALCGKHLEPPERADEELEYGRDF